MLGNAPALKLFDLIDIKRNNRTEGLARSFKDYDVKVGAAPNGVKFLNLYKWECNWGTFCTPVEISGENYLVINHL